MGKRARRREREAAQPKATTEALIVVGVLGMTDENFIRHLETRHTEILEVEFRPHPQQNERTLPTRTAWEAMHAVHHRRQIYEGFHLHEDMGER